MVLMVPTAVAEAWSASCVALAAVDGVTVLRCHTLRLFPPMQKTWVHH
jgi:hypothetical protein